MGIPEDGPALARLAPGLRVGTVQRERALEVLRNAAADERLTFEELEGRVPRALGAVTWCRSPPADPTCLVLRNDETSS